MNRAAIVGIAGTTLSPDETVLFDEQPPLGVILFRRNIEDRRQVADLTANIVSRTGGFVMIDQEGGRVARLTAPHWPRRSAAAIFGRLHDADPAAAGRAARLHGALIGADLIESGITVDCAPVLDRAVPGASDVIGDRAFAADPGIVAVLAGHMADGLLSVGVQPVGKHIPGHGRALVDSHLALPELDDLDAADLAPFELCRWFPWMMTAHIRFRRLDADRPATLSPMVIGGLIRERLGFDGVLVSDDLSMHAVSGPPSERAAACLAAGCDVALHCSGVFAETRAVLGAVGVPDAAAERRLDAAARMAAERRAPFDRAAAEAEYAALLAPLRA